MAEQMSTLVNVKDGPIYLDDGALVRFGHIPPNHSIQLTPTQMASSQVTSCLQLGWLVPANHPNVVRSHAAAAPGTVAHPGGGSDSPQNYPGVIAYPGMAGADAVHQPGVPFLPGVVGRQNFDEAETAPADIPNANSVITGRTVHDPGTPYVQPADATIRRGMAPATPAYHEPAGPVSANDVYRQAFDPRAPQRNFAIQGAVPPTPYPGTPPGYAPQGPTQGAGGAFVYPAGPGAPPPMAPPPPNYRPPYNPGQPGYQVVRHRGAAGGVQPIYVPPYTPSPVPRTSDMGSLILHSAYPTEREPMSIGDLSEIDTRSIGQATEALLHGVDRARQINTILQSYKEGDVNKRAWLVGNSQNLEVLYKLLTIENSPGLVGHIQNRIAALGGQVPDSNYVNNLRNQMAHEAAAQPQPGQAPPPPPPSPFVQGALLAYPDWEDGKKMEFISKVGEIDLLQKLKRREPSTVIQAQIDGRMKQIQDAESAATAAAAQAAQAAANAAAANVGVPTLQPGAPIPGAVSDRTIPSAVPPFMVGQPVPPAPAPVAPAPAYVPPVNPNAPPSAVPAGTPLPGGG